MIRTAKFMDCMGLVRNIDKINSLIGAIYYDPNMRYNYTPQIIHVDIEIVYDDESYGNGFMKEFNAKGVEDTKVEACYMQSDVYGNLKIHFQYIKNEKGYINMIYLNIENVEKDLSKYPFIKSIKKIVREQ